MQRLLALLPLAVGCHDIVEPSSSSLSVMPQGHLVLPTPAITALEADELTAVWLDRPLSWGEQVEWLDADGQWHPLGYSGQVWVHDQPVDCYRWRGVEGELVVRTQRGELLLEAPEAPLLHAPGDLAWRGMTWEGPSLENVELAVAVQREWDYAWLVHDGEQPRWTTEAQPVETFEPGQLPDLVDLTWPTLAHAPTVAEYTVKLLLMDGGHSWLLAQATTTVVELGRNIAWGDFHNHTNLSWDGCEDPDDFCTPRGETPGLDVFMQAEEAGLDFAALTDHGEWSRWENL